DSTRRLESSRDSCTKEISSNQFGTEYRGIGVALLSSDRVCMGIGRRFRNSGLRLLK
ncbi:42455_t:CDS:1, partial [Gigaspora margarita]